MVAIKRLNSTDSGFKAQLDELLAFEGAQDDRIEQTVAGILADVKRRGDAAVISTRLKACGKGPTRLDPTPLGGLDQPSEAFGSALPRTGQFPQPTALAAGAGLSHPPTARCGGLCPSSDHVGVAKLCRSPGRASRRHG